MFMLMVKVKKVFFNKIYIDTVLYAPYFVLGLCVLCSFLFIAIAYFTYKSAKTHYIKSETRKTILLKNTVFSIEYFLYRHIEM